MSSGRPQPRWIIGATNDVGRIAPERPLADPGCRISPPPFVDPRYRIAQHGRRVPTPAAGVEPEFGGASHSGPSGLAAGLDAANRSSAREPDASSELPIVRDPDAARFIGTTIQLFETEVLVVQVAPRVLGDRGEAPALVAAFQTRFRRTIVLVAQDARGVPTYFGPAPIAAVLANIPFDAFAWRRYRYRRPRPQMLPIPIEPLPSYTSDADWADDAPEPRETVAGRKREQALLRGGDNDDDARPRATVQGRRRESSPPVHRRTLEGAGVSGSTTADESLRRTRTLGGVAPPADRVLDEDRTVPRAR